MEDVSGTETGKGPSRKPVVDLLLCEGGYKVFGMDSTMEQDWSPEMVVHVTDLTLTTTAITGAVGDVIVLVGMSNRSRTSERGDVVFHG